VGFTSRAALTLRLIMYLADKAKIVTRAVPLMINLTESAVASVGVESAVFDVPELLGAVPVSYSVT
jgi:hypothetical protein